MVHSSRERAAKPHEQFKIGDLVCTADGYNHGGEDCDEERMERILQEKEQALQNEIDAEMRLESLYGGMT